MECNGKCGVQGGCADDASEKRDGRGDTGKRGLKSHVGNTVLYRYVTI